MVLHMNSEENNMTNKAGVVRYAMMQLITIKLRQIIHTQRECRTDPESFVDYYVINAMLALEISKMILSDY